jgi:hypothetical protein
MYVEKQNQENTHLVGIEWEPKVIHTVDRVSEYHQKLQSLPLNYQRNKKPTCVNQRGKILKKEQKV